MGYYFSWGCNDICSLDEESFLLQLILNRHVSPSNGEGFQIFTPTYIHVSSLMCQRDVGGVKGIGGPPLSILCTFYRRKVSMALEHAQAISILKHVVVIGEGSFKLGVISRGPPLSLFDMFLATKGGLGT
jgi:hypothetical protein